MLSFRIFYLENLLFKLKVRVKLAKRSNSSQKRTWLITKNISPSLPLKRIGLTDPPLTCLSENHAEKERLCTEHLATNTGCPTLSNTGQQDTKQRPTPQQPSQLSWSKEEQTGLVYFWRDINTVDKFKRKKVKKFHLYDRYSGRELRTDLCKKEQTHTVCPARKQDQKGGIW